MLEGGREGGGRRGGMGMVGSLPLRHALAPRLAAPHGLARLPEITWRNGAGGRGEMAWRNGERWDGVMGGTRKRADHGRGRAARWREMGRRGRDGMLEGQKGEGGVCV